MYKAFDGDDGKTTEHYDNWVTIFNTVEQCELELKKLPLWLENPLAKLSSKVKRRMVELLSGSCCSRATVSTAVTLVHHKRGPRSPPFVMDQLTRL